MIFLDAGFLYALVNKRDENHDRVLTVMREYRDRDLRKVGLTTNHVVEETVTLIKASGHRDPGLAHDAAVVVGRKQETRVVTTFHGIHAPARLGERQPTDVS